MSNKMAQAVFWFYRYQAHHSEEVFYEALRQLETGISNEPDCALCLAVVAHLYSDGVIYNYKTIEDPLGRSQDYLNRAFALHPNCQEGHLTQAWIFVLGGEREKAIASLEKCISINPNSSYFLATTSLGMAMTGEYERSLVFWEKAIQLSPLPYWWLNLPKIFIAIKNNNYQEAFFHSSKAGTPKMIYEHVFEMISLYFLADYKKLAALAIIYNQKFPGGLEFVSQSLPMIILDADLKAQVSHALHDIRENNFIPVAS
jgi:tetratricopeptide (TPR) repeat protein